ncbi:MAG: formylmethanofuran--tetrahydromethanopterin N-formyltransferase [Candidatus Bathyarchaeia archaeon]
MAGEYVVVKPREPLPDTSLPVLVNEFTEMFPMWVSRILITAVDEKWARRAGVAATGFAVSIIGSPAEAGVEALVPPTETPDGRPGVLVQFYHTDRILLKAQLLARLSQCVLTCPTTAAFDALKGAKRIAKVGKSLSAFGDGFQVQETLAGRKVWRVPVMEGEFIVEEGFGVKRAIAGGMFLILAADSSSGLAAAEKAVDAISSVPEVVTPFPGGICRSGSKVGSRRGKLPASTNELYCPTLREKIEGSPIPSDVKSVYEIVINGLSVERIKEALAAGIRAALYSPGVKVITSANYGGKLGRFQLYLADALSGASTAA